MDQKYGEFVGVDNLHAAIIVRVEENYIAETPSILPHPQGAGKQNK